MAVIKAITNIQILTTITLSEEELRALDGLVGYGYDAFKKAFYEKLGTNYMRDHEEGLKKLFETVREQVPAIIERTDRARLAFKE